ncbi:MAG TPA: hypothetical protein VES02_11035 [Dermatophilaceae bacterium]|nr:hypothetical protein [Dermatophilaceae bacterium]
MTADAAAASLGMLIAAQRPDGTWGRSEVAAARIVPTIFAARSLQESEVSGGDLALARALDFLTEVAVVEGGGSIGGTRDSVLSCYTGMLAQLFLRSGRVQDARPLVEWIQRYQPVAFGDRTYYRPSAEWGEYLHHRYGGCMAATTCFLGLVPTMMALALARRAGLATDSSPQESAFRDLLIERRLIFGRSGEVMPLAGRTKADPSGTRWLMPAFPLDYVVDLISLVQVAREVGVPWEAMTEATDLISSWRLPGGGWPMLGKRRLVQAYRPEPVDRARPSELITRRVHALQLPTAAT